MRDFMILIVDDSDLFKQTEKKRTEMKITHLFNYISLYLHYLLLAVLSISLVI